MCSPALGNTILRLGRHLTGNFSNNDFLETHTLTRHETDIHNGKTYSDRCLYHVVAAGVLVSIF